MSELVPLSDVVAYPFPEAVQNDASEEWVVINGTPKADFGRNLLSVPLKDHPVAHNVRSHTLGKIKWSSNLDGLKIRAGKDTISAVDELRITHLLQRRAQVDTSLGYMSWAESSQHMDKFIEDKNLRLMVLYLLCHGRTANEQKLLDQLEATKVPEAEMAREIVRETLRMAEECLRLDANDLKGLAEHIEKRLAQAEIPKEKPPEPEEHDNIPETDHQIADDIKRMQQEGMEEMLLKIMRQEWRIDQDFGEWGDLEWSRPPLNSVIKPRMVHKKMRSSESGIILGDISRLWSDGKIWSAPVRSRGGGVLVDCSGSMSLSQSQIESLVRAAPALSVALYSGSGDKGVIREVVKQGRICESSYIKSPGGGSNVVDGPCIERWLALQPAPRLWISDGWVNGRGGKTAQNLFDEAMELCRKYSIMRVNNMGIALELFKKIERGGGMVHPALRHRQNKDVMRAK